MFSKIVNVFLGHYKPLNELKEWAQTMYTYTKYSPQGIEDILSAGAYTCVSELPKVVQLHAH